MILRHYSVRGWAARGGLLVLTLVGTVWYAAAWLSPASGQGLKSGTTQGAIISEPLGMSGWASAPIAVTAQQLGMTGWRSEPIAATAAQLGMTGWRSEPAAATAPQLGMTGWRSEPVAATTPQLGMTGWRSEPIRLMAQPLGMTGWQDETDKQPPPAIVCLGGQVMNVAARGSPPKYTCSCPTGRTAQAMASNYKNTFQCIPDTVATPPPPPPPPPKIACIGGAVRNGQCVCANGFTLTRTGPTSYQCTRVAILPPPPKIVCSGGSVRNNVCVCQAGFTPVKTGATSYRCQRVAVLPPVTIPNPSGPVRTFQPQRVPSQPGTVPPAIRAVPQRVR